MHRVCMTISATLLMLLTSVGVGASDVEVLHWWTSAGEQKALDILKADVSRNGLQWIDFAITGGGGDNANNVLKSRIISGNPPTTAQIKGPTIQQWSALGLISDIERDAIKGQWDDVIPEPLQAGLKFDGKYVAAPINIHRINWMWVNPGAFRKIHRSIPTTWAEFFEVAPLLKEQGITPLAMGREDWQYATLFETVLVSTAGADFYRKALIELDPKALNSTEMVRVFETLSSIRALLSPTDTDSRWDSATRQVISGQAAIQLTGDWAKGELIAAGKVPDKDILCLPAPGTSKDFIYNIDSMVMFRMSEPEQKNAQSRMASLLMSPEFQKAFNQAKGSLPIRRDVNLKDFDACARKSRADFDASTAESTLLPSMTHFMAINERVRRSFLDVIDHFFRHPRMTADEASKQLEAAVTASH